MKIVRFNGGRIGVVRDHQVFDVTKLVGCDPTAWPPVCMTRFIKDFHRTRSKLDGDLSGVPVANLDAITLETPVPWPQKLIAIPVNYRAHAIEMSSPAISINAGFFMKSNSSLSGAGEPIILPKLKDREIHHEAEVAVIIGREGRGISRESALDYIFGYACLLDITVRGKQERAMRKSFDTFTPVGPWIVTSDEAGDPTDFQVRLWVNDELRQDANTRDMILGIAELIEMTSAVMTLQPGDIIATGTGEGVGPIRSGDTVTIDISRVGQMAVRVVQGDSGSTVALQ